MGVERRTTPAGADPVGPAAHRDALRQRAGGRGQPRGLAGHRHGEVSKAFCNSSMIPSTASSVTVGVDNGSAARLGQAGNEGLLPRVGSRGGVGLPQSARAQVRTCAHGRSASSTCRSGQSGTPPGPQGCRRDAQELGAAGSFLPRAVSEHADELRLPQDEVMRPGTPRLRHCAVPLDETQRGL